MTSTFNTALGDARSQPEKPDDPSLYSRVEDDFYASHTGQGSMKPPGWAMEISTSHSNVTPHLP